MTEIKQVIQRGVGVVGITILIVGLIGVTVGLGWVVYVGIDWIMKELTSPLAEAISLLAIGIYVSLIGTFIILFGEF